MPEPKDGFTFETLIKNREEVEHFKNFLTKKHGRGKGHCLFSSLALFSFFFFHVVFTGSREVSLAYDRRESYISNSLNTRMTCYSCETKNRIHCGWNGSWIWQRSPQYNIAYIDQIVYMKYREDPDTSTPENTLNSPVPRSRCFLVNWFNNFSHPTGERVSGG